MTTEEKAKAYEMALEAARKELGVDRKEWEVVQQVLHNIFPELHESEDERIREEIINYLDFAESHNLLRAADYEKKKGWLAYLEKQKEIDSTPLDWNDYKDKPVEVWNAYLRGKAVGIEIGKQEEQKSTDEDEKIRKVLINYFKGSVGLGVALNGVSVKDIVAYLEKQKEKKFDLLLIKQAWYMEGYKDREFGKESRWIIKTGEGGPEYELNPKYGQPLAKMQKPATFNEPYNSDEYEAVEIGNATCLRRKEQKPAGDKYQQELEATDRWQEGYEAGFNAASKPAEWSEEDEEMTMKIDCYLSSAIGVSEEERQNIEKWLKSLRPQSKQGEKGLILTEEQEKKFGHLFSRPSWKPSEEQMNCLCAAVDDAIRKHNESVSGYEPARVLKSLYEDLQRL